MRSRLFGLGLVVALPAVAAAALPLFCSPPAHAEEELTPIWGMGSQYYAKRPVAGNPGTMEDDKGQDDHGGTTTFNKDNLEVKCQAQRGDGDAPKSASGYANYLQEYKWLAFGTTTPPSQYFVIDYTLGTECNATPFSDASISDPALRAGPASSTGSLTSANNGAITEMHRKRRLVADDELIDTGDSHPLKYFADAPVNASASASSIDIIPVQQPSEGPPPPPPTPTYPNKGCFAEGRSYWKFSAPRSYTPAP